MIFSILTMYNQILELYLYCRCGSGSLQGRIQDFKLGGGGAHKKLRRAGGGGGGGGRRVNHERQYPHSSTLYRCVLNNICRFETNYVYSINGGVAFPISRSIELFLSLFVIRGNGPNEYQMIYFN